MTILAAVGMTREAAVIHGPGVRAVAGGGRAELLESRLRAALGADIRAVISIGVGGALDPTLAVGGLVIGSAVLDGAARWPTSSAWAAALAAALPGGRVAPVLGAAHMVLAASDKARLYAASGAALVDMESHVAARLAAERGLPFAVLRTVSDAGGVDLPPAVLHGLKPDGSADLAGILAALVRDPRQLAALMRTGHDVQRALRALAAARTGLGDALALPPL